MDGVLNRTCIRTCDKVSFFNRKISVDTLTGITLLSEWLPCFQDSIPLSISKPNDEASVPYLASMEKFDCITCNVSCQNPLEMKIHFKSRTHIDNISKLINLPKTEASSWPAWEDTSDGSTDDSSSECSAPSSPNISIGKNGTKSEKQLELSATYGVHCKDALGQPMIFFRNRKSEIVGIFRCLLYTKTSMPSSVEDLLKRVDYLRQSRHWAILLYSGGKFSCGIFDEDKELIHKTFHKYTVRAKQGGSQTSRDGAAGGMGGPKSAGSALRRHGEMAIRTEINQLLHVKWRGYLQACQFILTWTPKVHRGIFFNPPSSQTTTNIEMAGEATGVGPQSTEVPPPVPAADLLAAEAVAARMGVTQNDPRLRRLPCRAKNITYQHVKELQKEFSTFQIFDSIANPDLICKSAKKQLSSQIEADADTVFQSKSGRLFLGTPPKLLPKLKSHEEEKNGEEVQKEKEIIKKLEKKTEEEKHKINRQKKRMHRNDAARRLNEVRPDSSDASDLEKTADDWIKHASPPTASTNTILSALCTTYSSWHRSVRMATAMGDHERLTQLLNQPSLLSVTASNESSQNASLTQNVDTVKKSVLALKNSISNTNVSSADISPTPEGNEVAQLLNYRLTDGRSLLHLAVELQGDPKVIQILLSSGCRPDARDTNGMTPYRLATQLGKKKLPVCFKKFRQTFPDRYDYSNTDIPCRLDPPSDSNCQTMKSVKEKPARRRKPATSKKLPQVDIPPAQMASLSIRERCALAAESRAKAGRPTGPVIICNQCRVDLTDKQPFTYMDFKFCSIGCLRTHRSATSVR